MNMEFNKVKAAQNIKTSIELMKGDCLDISQPHLIYYILDL